VTPADPSSPSYLTSPTSPWERWAWVFAGVWLVFLVYPVIETFQSTDSVVVTTLGLTFIAAFAAVYLAGYGWLAHRPWLVFGLLVALALATATIIGVQAIGRDPGRDARTPRFQRAPAGTGSAPKRSRPVTLGTPSSRGRRAPTARPAAGARAAFVAQAMIASTILV